MIGRERFVELATADEPVVVYAAADLDVDAEPLSAYAALTGRTAEAGAHADAAPYSFLLESAEKVASSDPDGAFAPDPRAGRHARYSFVGYDPDAVVTVEPDGAAVEVLDERYAGLVSADGGDTVDALRAALPDAAPRGFPDAERQHLGGGLVGFLAYDAVYDLWLEEVGVARPDSRFPDAEFVLTTTTVVFDHLEDTVSLVFTPVVRPGDDPGTLYDGLAAEAERVEALLGEAGSAETGGFRRERETAGPRPEYEAAVRRAKEHVLDGDIYQGVVSRKRELYGEVDPLGLYAALRDVNPSPYMYLLAHDDLTIVGASPETLVSVRGEEVMSNPIAGTCSRGSSPVEDRRLAGEMLADAKERAEHTMLVDLARNDVRRVSRPGSVRVEEFMNVLKYSHVQHIESTVTGKLAPDADAFDAARAAFPAGTLSGAPKIRAMEIIDDLEREPRGVYGGGVGYFAWNGDADFAIVIRTATVEHGTSRRTGDEVDGTSRRTADEVDGTSRRSADEVDGTSRRTADEIHDAVDRITVQAGAGIVADSVPEREYEETEQKMDGVLAALERIEGAGAGEPSETGAADATGETHGTHGMDEADEADETDETDETGTSADVAGREVGR